MKQRSFVASLLVILTLQIVESSAQNEFDKYGPFGSAVHKDLKEAIKLERGVFKMDLSYQKLDKALYEKLPRLVDLQALKLSGNGVEDYPKGFESLFNLVYFASYNNKFHSFPEQLRPFHNLQYLELQHTTIDSIPARIAFLDKLQTFKFGNTDDTLKFPGTIKYLRNLRDLCLENCILDSLPKSVLRIPTLRFLLLSNTNTYYLSKHFERLPNLEVLVVENNHLTKIPFDIYKSTKLRVVSFRGNKLTTIPDSMSQLEELSLLDLRGNNIDAEELEKIRSMLPGCEVKF
jgi:leucine-rich repeat protein SHOC2